METCWMLITALFIGVVTSSSAETAHQYYYEDGYLSDWDPDQWQSTGMQQHQPKCVDIPSDLTLCQGIGYTKMRLPNLLDHDAMDEVKDQARAWVSLKNLQCHPDTQLFLCSLFSPVCLPRPIWPCRSLCESVKKGCESRMAKYGYPWPNMLRCDKFPLDNDMCIMPQGSDKRDDNICEACNQPSTLEAIVDNFCSADFVMKVKIRENVIVDGDVKLVSFQKNRLYKKGSLKKRDVKELTIYMEGGAQCECAALDSSNKKRYYMVMGHRKGKKLVTSFIQIYSSKSADMKQALRKIRKDKSICQTGGEVIGPAAQKARSAPKVVGGEVEVRKQKDREGRKTRKDKKPRSERRRRKDKEGKKKKVPTATLR